VTRYPFTPGILGFSALHTYNTFILESLVVHPAANQPQPCSPGDSRPSLPRRQVLFAPRYVDRFHCSTPKLVTIGRHGRAWHHELRATLHRHDVPISFYHNPTMATREEQRQPRNTHRYITLPRDTPCKQATSQVVSFCTAPWLAFPVAHRLPGSGMLPLMLPPVRLAC
jgi:hypothetical protein